MSEAHWQELSGRSGLGPVVSGGGVVGGVCGFVERKDEDQTIIRGLCFGVLFWTLLTIRVDSGH